MRFLIHIIYSRSVLVIMFTFGELLHVRPLNHQAKNLQLVNARDILPALVVRDEDLEGIGLSALKHRAV